MIIEDHQVFYEFEQLPVQVSGVTVAFLDGNCWLDIKDDGNAPYVAAVRSLYLCSPDTSADDESLSIMIDDSYVKADFLRRAVLKYASERYRWGFIEDEMLQDDEVKSELDSRAREFRGE